CSTRRTELWPAAEPGAGRQRGPHAALVGAAARGGRCVERLDPPNDDALRSRRGHGRAKDPIGFGELERGRVEPPRSTLAADWSRGGPRLRCVVLAGSVAECARARGGVHFFSFPARDRDGCADFAVSTDADRSTTGRSARGAQRVPVRAYPEAFHGET